MPEWLWVNITQRYLHIYVYINSYTIHHNQEMDLT